jgi:hypothetical protein
VSFTLYKGQPLVIKVKDLLQGEENGGFGRSATGEPKDPVSRFLVDFSSFRSAGDVSSETIEGGGRCKRVATAPFFLGRKRPLN